MSVVVRFLGLFLALPHKDIHFFDPLRDHDFQGVLLTEGEFLVIPPAVEAAVLQEDERTVGALLDLLYF